MVLEIIEFVCHPMFDKYDFESVKFILNQIGHSVPRIHNLRIIIVLGETNPQEDHRLERQESL